MVGQAARRAGFVRSSALAYPTVSLMRWRPLDGKPNFGDDLSFVIVNLMLARQGRTLEDEARQARQMLAIGSILHFAQTGATVWGSGVNGKVAEDEHSFDSLDVRMVRGPRTQAWLKDKRNITAPSVFGDPALLLPRLAAGRFAPKATRRAVFVPNLNDLKAQVDFALPSDVDLVSPMQAWHKAVADILSAEMIVATSLHGLVIAEAYGLPARYVRLSAREHLFKFEDYYQGTGRAEVEPASSVAEALEMGGAPAPVVDLDAMEAAFPYDLWTT